MRPLAAAELRGNWATLLSSWNSDGSPDYGLIGAEIDALLTAGVDGVYSNGTAGEFHSQLRPAPAIAMPQNTSTMAILRVRRLISQATNISTRVVVSPDSASGNRVFMI